MRQNVEYFEKAGELWFRYEETVSLPTQHHAARYREYGIEEQIPKELQDRGDLEAINEYAEDRISKKIGRAKKRSAAQDKYSENPNFPISVEHNGIVLRGKIVSVTDSFLGVRLESPAEFSGEDGINYGFSAAMSGKYIFSGHKQFSNDAVATARRLLIEIYRKKKHEADNAKVVSLARRLNQR